jgi:hypothetical protein
MNQAPTRRELEPGTIFTGPILIKGGFDESSPYKKGIGAWPHFIFL